MKPTKRKLAVVGAFAAWALIGTVNMLVAGRGVALEMGLTLWGYRTTVLVQAVVGVMAAYWAVWMYRQLDDSEPEERVLNTS